MQKEFNMHSSTGNNDLTSLSRRAKLNGLKRTSVTVNIVSRWLFHSGNIKIPSFNSPTGKLINSLHKPLNRVGGTTLVEKEL